MCWSSAADASPNRRAVRVVLGSGRTGRRDRQATRSGEVVLNRQLADELDAQVGDTVTLRLPKPEDIPADSPLGEKTDRIRSLPGSEGDRDHRESGLGPVEPASQPKRTAQRVCGLGAAAKCLSTSRTDQQYFGRRADTGSGPGEEASARLAAALHPSLDDLGLNVKHPRLIFAGREQPGEEVIYDYYTYQQRSHDPAAGRGAGGRHRHSQRKAASRYSPTWPTASNLLHRASGPHRPASRSRIRWSRPLIRRPISVLRDLEQPADRPTGRRRNRADLLGRR